MRKSLNLSPVAQRLIRASHEWYAALAKSLKQLLHDEIIAATKKAAMERAPNPPTWATSLSNRLDKLVNQSSQHQRSTGYLAEKFDKSIAPRSRDPIALDLAAVFHELSKTSNTPPEEMKVELKDIMLQIKNLLGDHGYKLISPKPGGVFDPSKQQILDTTPTDVAKRDKRIAQVFQAGLQTLTGEVVRTARVSLYTFKTEKK